MILLLCILLAVYVVPAPWSAVVVVAGIVLEVLEVLGLRAWAGRLARRTRATTGPEALVGRTAEVVEPCRPEGTVRLDGTLWEATCTAGAPRGARVRVQSVEQLRLTVVPS